MVEQVELLPCPFCGDAMEIIPGDVLRHRDQGECPIGVYAWAATDRNIAAWRTRATLTPASSGQGLREAYMVLREALFDICDLTSEDGLANRQEIWGVASEALDRIGPDGAALNRTPDPVAGPSGDRAALAAIERSERILLRPSIVPDLEGNFGPELAFDPTPCPEWPAGAWQCGLPDHDLYYGATPNDALAAWEAAQLRATQAGIGEEG